MAPHDGYSRLLIVEGNDDKHSVISLMAAHIDWPDQAPWPVFVKLGSNPDEILKSSGITAQLIEASLEVLGIMLDADNNPRGRYDSLRNTCRTMFPSIPETMPPEGLIVDNPDRSKRLGMWIMPDNISEGCLEVFLRYLVPNEAEPLWALAVQSVAQARVTGARCPERYVPKADLYTWLAWQDPPGRSPGEALTQKILDTGSPHSAKFVAWFKALYSL